MDLHKTLIYTATLFFIVATTSASADWSIAGPANEDPQNIVIVVSENPMSNPERTCLAVTLARVMSTNTYRQQNVTIFATLDGSALGVESEIDKPRFKCALPDGFEAPVVSLKQNVENFLADNPNNLVLCPLCFMDRFGTAHDYGVLPGVDSSGTAVIDVFANADKVIDF